MRIGADTVRSFLKFALLAVLGWLFVRLVRANWEDFGRVLDLGVPELSALSLVFLGNTLIRGRFLCLLLEGFGVGIGLFEGVRLVLLRGCANLLVVKGGLVVYMRHLKSRHAMFYTSSASTMIMANVLQIGVGSLGLAAGAAWPFLARGEGNAAVLLPVLAGTAVVFLLLYLPAAWYAPIGRVHRWIGALVADWTRLRGNRRLLSRLAAVQVAFLLSASANMWLALAFLGSGADFSAALFLTSAAQVGTVVALTPAGLGIREGLMAYAGKVLGVGLAVSLAAASVTRVVSLFWMLLLGGPALLLWSRRGSGPDPASAPDGAQ